MRQRRQREVCVQVWQRSRRRRSKRMEVRARVFAVVRYARAQVRGRGVRAAKVCRLGRQSQGR